MCKVTSVLAKVFTYIIGVQYLRNALLGINVCDVPLGNSSKLLPGTTTEGFISPCQFTELEPFSVSATEITIGDPLCTSSSDKRFAAVTMENKYS